MCIKSLPILINTYSIRFDVPHCPAQCFASPSLTRRSTKHRLRLQLDSVMGSRRALANITEIYADITYIYIWYTLCFMCKYYTYIYTYTWNRMNLWTHHFPSNMFRFPGNPTLECRAHAWKCLPRSASGVAAKWWANKCFVVPHLKWNKGVGRNLFWCLPMDRNSCSKVAPDPNGGVWCRESCLVPLVGTLLLT